MIQAFAARREGRDGVFLMAKALTPDICVIGAGPGGLAVALEAAANGVSVVLVEKGMLGGGNLEHVLPSATLAALARQAQAMRCGARLCAEITEPDINFKAAMASARATTADALPAVSAERLATLGITVIKAEARFTGRRRLVAGETEIKARRFVLATGSSPAIPAIEGLDGVGCLTPDTVFELARKPGHLVIVGGDARGLEIAQAFRRLGAQVTVLAETAILPGEDPEMVAVIARRLRAEGVVVREDTKVTAVQRRGKTSVRVLVGTDNPEEIDGSHLLAATGRKANVETLDLKKAGVALKEGAVDVSAMLRTTNRRIYAIGDVTGGSPSAHRAAYQARLVLKALLFRLPAKDRTPVPRAINTDPGLAHVGLTEADSRRRHRKLAVLRWAYSDNDSARASGQTEGHVKLVATHKGDILGVTIAGANAAELIGQWQLALSRGLGLKDMASAIPPHPTLAEIGKSAAIAYFEQKARRPFRRITVRMLQLFG